MKKLFWIFFCLTKCLTAEITLPESYPHIVEQLLYFKDDQFKVYYGGPIDNDSGVKWMMPAFFEDENHRIRSAYEISFINCLPESLDKEQLDVFYIKISDIDVKFQNQLSEDLSAFHALISNKDKTKKCILIREVDVSNICYPAIFNAAIYSDIRGSDKDELIHFLKKKFQTKGKLIDLTKQSSKKEKRCIEQFEGLIERKKVAILFENENRYFNIDHYYLENDPWKSYYIVTCFPKEISDFPTQESILVRLDSGCNSGQIYLDSSCDCQNQLFKALADMSQVKDKPSLLIHIPAHDGRGFGVAPKAETEIYKRGGKGRVNQTNALNTIEAAILLYRTTNFDIRTYDGCAKILKIHQISEIDLMTDNKLKINNLAKNEITVNRVKTNTAKATCMDHLHAKKQSKHYFVD